MSVIFYILCVAAEFPDCPEVQQQMNFKGCSPGHSCQLLERRSERIQEMPDVTQAAEKQNISLDFLLLCLSEVTVLVLCPPLNSPSLGIQ